MTQPIFFNTHRSIQDFIKVYKSHSSEDWQDALRKNLVVNLKDHRTYLHLESSKVKDADKKTNLGAKIPFLSQSQSKERKKHAPNEALADVLILYDAYDSEASNQFASPSTDSFWSCPETKKDNELPMFTASGVTFSLKILEKSTHNALLNILRKPQENSQQLKENLRMIGDIALRNPNFYYPNSDEVLNEGEIYLNDALLSFLLVVKNRDFSFQKKVGHELKHYHSNHKLWLKIYPVEIFLCIFISFCFDRLYALTDVVRINLELRILAFLLPIPLNSGFVLNKVNTESVSFQGLVFFLFFIADRLSKTASFDHVDGNVSDFLLPGVARVSMLYILYSSMDVICENFKRVLHSIKEVQIAGARISQLEDTDSCDGSSEIVNVQAMSTM